MPRNRRNTGPGKPAERFRVARTTLFVDALMNRLIQVAGIGIILAVAGIFLFILVQIFPLFRGASVWYERSFDLGNLDVAAVGIDPWAALPLIVTSDGTLHFLDIEDPGAEYNRGLFVADPGLPEDKTFSFVRFDRPRGQVLFGTEDGRFSAVKVGYRQTHPEYREREVVPVVRSGPLLQLGREDAPYEQIEFVDAGRTKLAAAVQRRHGRQELHAVTLSERRGLLGDGALRREREYELTDLFEGRTRFLRVTGDGDFVIVGTDDGRIHLLARESGDFELRQSVRPFADLEDPGLASMNFLLGDVSLSLTSSCGENRIYSIYHNEAEGRRVLGRIGTLPRLAPGTGAGFHSSSLRNKAFLTGAGDYASIRYATTGATRWEGSPGFPVRHAVLGDRYDRIVFLDDVNRLHLFGLRDPHPETGFRAYFGKIHYEGRSEPEFLWQSTGGGDEFEPKLSMVPLILGTMKGTVYAMLFAVPIALLAALYTSQFLKPSLRRVVKPVMEILESVPTVVLGFLAALWFAPIISGSVPSVFLVCLALPLAAIALGAGVANLPRKVRRWVPTGYEFAVFAPFMVAFGWVAWSLGPVMEGWLFSVEDPDTGRRIADFRLWWELNSGLSFEQRNALVVGLFMGFAIIPTIFTIAEDSLSNVPQAFRSGSFALGASRWQTAVNVVLPTAAAGIFSALMIGFGRAVGETMIVLMATGNTPVMSLNLFEGMRTLAANIAVELPEAAQGGSLYRSLFLGAMLLFLMTFLVNTFAEILRKRLRDRFKAVE